MCCLLLMTACTVCGQDGSGENGYAEARRAMVTQQIIARGVTDDQVINAMRTVPRHRFVPFLFKSLAYNDRPLPIGHDQTISQPYIVALMTELLSLRGDEKVLEIGTGSGYQAAVLAQLADEVYSIEIVEPLAQRSRRLLQEMGYDNVTVRCGDGYKGWREHAPFDAIIITCAPPEIPDELIAQLGEGGRMVVPVGTYHQELLLITKEKGTIKTRDVLPVRFVPMVKGE